MPNLPGDTLDFFFPVVSWSHQLIRSSILLTQRQVVSFAESMLQNRWSVQPGYPVKYYPVQTADLLTAIWQMRPHILTWHTRVTMGAVDCSAWPVTRFPPAVVNPNQLTYTEQADCPARRPRISAHQPAWEPSLREYEEPFCHRLAVREDNRPRSRAPGGFALIPPWR